MHKRINITLPEKTVDLIDQITKKGDRSRFIDEAVRRYIDDMDREHLREQVKEGAIQRAEADLAIAREWFPLDEEVWQKSRV